MSVSTRAGLFSAPSDWVARSWMPRRAKGPLKSLLSSVIGPCSSILQQDAAAAMSHCHCRSRSHEPAI
jgi:hypothetical protein